MNYRNCAIAASAVLLAGCASHHGTYEPACIAFAGDRVTLDGSNFTWDRTTDAVRVNDAGKVVDPYPDYPRSGSYTVRGNTFSLSPESGDEINDMYLQKIEGRYRLLTKEQYESWEERREYDNCVLTLDGGEFN